MKRVLIFAMALAVGAPALAEERTLGGCSNTLADIANDLKPSTIILDKIPDTKPDYDAVVKLLTANARLGYDLAEIRTAHKILLEDKGEKPTILIFGNRDSAEIRGVKFSKKARQALADAFDVVSHEMIAGSEVGE